MFKLNFDDWAELYCLGIAIAAIFTIYIPKFNPNQESCWLVVLSGVMTIIL